MPLGSSAHRARSLTAKAGRQVAKLDPSDRTPATAWMAPKCRDSKMLEADVDEILDNFGTKYKFAF